MNIYSASLASAPQTGLGGTDPGPLIVGNKVEFISYVGNSHQLSFSFLGRPPEN
jgi:hypothetical protein